MTKEETVKIMAMLGAFYSGGKNDPRIQAQAWHLILAKYPYDVAEAAVLHFAENDTREYATFPTVGTIVAEIKAEQMRLERPIKEIVKAISYGWDYDQLSEDARRNITEEHYSEWLHMDAEEFANKIGAFTTLLKGSRLLENKDGQDQ